MTTTHPTAGSTRVPLRLWPGVAAALVILVLRYVVPVFMPDAIVFGILAGVAGGAIILLWWLFFSRAPWIERIVALLLMVGTTMLASRVVHESIANGLMGRMVFIYAVPATLSLTFVAWAVFSRGLTSAARWTTMVLAILAGTLGWALVRTDGIMGAGAAQLAWRWSPTPVGRLLAASASGAETRPAEPATAPPAPAPSSAVPPAASSTPAAAPSSAAIATAAPAPATRVDPPAPRWPGFRGPARDGIVHDVRIDTDWTARPPVELWRRPVGPGWSSFAVSGSTIYTQEQRGEQEVVAAYDLATGKPVWSHGDPVRFWESNGGAGPRATPTVAGGRIYSVGATGLLNVLDAATGRKIWSKDVRVDTAAAIPYWGFSSSPVLTGDLVIVHVGGLVAYDRGTGERRWLGASKRGSYSSPHLVTIDGVEQIVQLNGAGAMAVSPADGQELWSFSWEGTPIVQPALVEERDLLIASGDMMGGMGLRRISLQQRDGRWTAEDRWTSRALKPYFNDFVVHEGHAYGFDGSILACVELAKGERRWKNGRYGQGQMVLLAEQDLLLVVSEEGDLVLVSATPDRFTEIAKIKAIEGKTWNHPVLAGDTLLVRNGEEMAAYRLAKRRR
jgi:outer membrane protein assembly factor BamB